ncbi:uncharacterized protein FOBCDRAFT_148607 [Fusarium oxysporum Fo47]|uniref:NACHT domain-containing protein n=1 Tax=Fusarium oxysporum Fo47 TaxID=660027 RepID=W9JIL0_FUSOX|nr:uncharacterized protein FOBCDRAFT_148607 [Fusarium oxysporum Fo47]EWZ30319.1 hypothetical protein FOZG_15810 [Fusarium oxysporum Fo47]QKD62212.2 hypothetical protein FOBCDRAFT_148607 [Fusarium oxysporum Fo47]
MAEALGVVASAIAVIQISKEVISLCKFYIEALRSDAPTSLRAVLIEVSTLKSVLEGLEFISKCGTFTPALQNRLAASDGPIEGSRVAMTALEKLFPKQALQNGQNASKRQKVQAAFATLAWPLKQGQVQDLLQQISRHKDDIQLVLTTEATKDIKDIKAVSEEIRSILTGEQRHRVYDWLTSTDPSPIHNRSRKLYEHGTGSWMLRSQHWTDWLASSVRCLWVHGIPGSGKTILASWLIENVQDHCERVSTENSPCTSAYYYCYFGHHQDEAAPFLRWIITQLSRQAEVVSTLMHDLFKRGGEPSITELFEALEQILQVFSCVYIVIDAVDESSPRDDLLEVIHTLVIDQRFSNLQILVTSREYIDIERVMEKVSVSLPMSNELVEQDIRLHVQSILRSNPKFRCWPDDLLIEVEESVSTKAEGMFRWAVCQLHELQRLKGERNVVIKALERLPKDLDETYDRIFLRIPREDWQFVSHAFQWLWFYGELGPPENGTPSVLLLDAIKSSTSRTEKHKSHVLYNSERLRELCGCLISNLEDSISFAHYTVKEYLDSARIRQGSLFVFSTEQAKVLSICLDVLLFQAKALASQNLKDLRGGGPLPLGERDLWSNLSFHSFFHVITSLRLWGQEISKSDDFYGRVKSLLCPSTQGYSSDTLLETIDWEEHLTYSDASLFLSLLLITNDMESPVSSRLIRQTDLKALFSKRIVLEKERYIHIYDKNGDATLCSRTYKFDGPLIEVMFQFLNPNSWDIRRLLVNYTGLYNPSTTLILFIGHYKSDPEYDESIYNRPSFCPLRHLLEAGAQPNLPGYPITPLQIAVATQNLTAVRLMLHFRADPNYIGDPLRSTRPVNSEMAEFGRFHVDENELGGELKLKTIQQLLLAYGGRDFQWDPSKSLTA